MGHRVESELVANVIAVQVAADQVVAVGDELVLLESMKMEIPVLADRSGRVLEVKVAAVDVVQEGEVLDLGGKRVRQISTPHVPHGWEAQR